MKISILIRSQMPEGRTVCLLVFAMALARCASVSRTIDPYPAQTDPQHHTQAYQANPGTLQPADPYTAAMELGIAVVGKALSKEEVERSERLRAQSIRVVCHVARVPCSQTQIFLSSAESSQIIQGRTNDLGEVWFLVQPKLTYQITLSPSQRTAQKAILSPPGPYSAGAWVDLEIANH